MSARKSERIMNLVICLLMARRFVEREQIRELVDGYRDLSDVAFQRTFERDKDELRALGVPVEVGSNSPLFPDDVGYRIRRRDFELPPLEFDAAETAALGVASTVWESARVNDQAVNAVAKLRGLGLDPDAGRVAGFVPSVGAAEPAFEPLWQATLGMTPVKFRYRDVDRVVEPWRLVSRNGAWYLVGFDRTRGEGRSFKVARIDGLPKVTGKAESFELPAPEVIAAQLARLEPERPSTAIIAVRDGAAPDLLRFAHASDAVAPEGFSAWTLNVGAPADAAGELAAWGADVIVVAPARLRAAVIKHLKAVAAWA